MPSALTGQTPSLSLPDKPGRVEWGQVAAIDPSRVSFSPRFSPLGAQEGSLRLSAIPSGAYWVGSGRNGQKYQ
jgi:hypothetical protein